MLGSGVPNSQLADQAETSANLITCSEFLGKIIGIRVGGNLDIEIRQLASAAPEPISDVDPQLARHDVTLAGGARAREPVAPPKQKERGDGLGGAAPGDHSLAPSSRAVRFSRPITSSTYRLPLSVMALRTFTNASR